MLVVQDNSAPMLLLGSVPKDQSDKCHFRPSYCRAEASQFSTFMEPVLHRSNWFWTAPLPSESGFSSFEQDCDHARRRERLLERLLFGVDAGPRGWRR